MERLLPSALVTMVTLALCASFAYFYQPPSNDARLFPNVSPAFATCAAIVALNAAVWLAWKWPPFYLTMNKYFVLVPGYPFAMSIIGNTISHSSFFHLANNMFWLFTVGIHLHDLIGRGNFLALYGGLSALSSWTSLSTHVARNFLITETRGASGAVLGVIAAYLWLKEE